MAEIPSNIAEAKGKVDFGLITIREDEFSAVLERLPVQQIVVGRQRYAMSRLTTVIEDDYVIASVRSLEPGTGQAQDVARTMIDELDPQWILVVGIAGSIPDYEYTLGDVILASRLHDFGVSAMIEGEDGKTRQEFASGGGPMHPEVQSLIANLPALNPFLDEWFLPSAVSTPRPTVKFSADNFYGNDAWKKKVRDCLKNYFGKYSKRDHPRALAASVASSGILLNKVVEKVVDLYVAKIDKVTEKSKADVVLCAPSIEHLKLVTHVPGESQTPEEVPAELQQGQTSPDAGEDSPQKETTWYEFHDLLKAKSLHLRTPLQHILPATYDQSKAAAQKKLKNRDQQDEATRAWNLFTAIYYKAQGIPWRMTRDDADVRTCYVVVSFFRTLDKERIYASSAQVSTSAEKALSSGVALLMKIRTNRSIWIRTERII